MSKSDASTVGWFARRSRRARWGLGAGAVLAAIAAAAWFATPWYVHTRLVPRLLAHYGLTVTAERRDVSIVEGAAEFHGVHVFDGKEEVLTAKAGNLFLYIRV
jgi:ferric-dicitrate binding protein FerR (iron transport regulator)